MPFRKYEDKNHAELYSKYRPTYPINVYENIAKFYNDAEMENQWELAVDVGCGNGQSTLPLCKYFKHVIGYDVSSQQIEHASKDNKKLTFKVGPAENLSFLNDNSVDLVIAFQAVHWFDMETFYKEVTRVLKYGGVFAAYGYGIPSLDLAEAHEEYKRFYSETVLPYIDQQSVLVNIQHYRNISFPFENVQRIENNEVEIHKLMSVDDFIGYTESTVGWRNYAKENPTSHVLKNLQARLKATYQENRMAVTWPGFMLMGKKPSKLDKYL